MARANSIFSLDPDAFPAVERLGPQLEKKVIVEIAGCKGLPANPKTTTTDSYVSIRLKEVFKWQEPSSKRRQSSLSSLSLSMGKGLNAGFGLSGDDPFAMSNSPGTPGSIDTLKRNSVSGNSPDTADLQTEYIGEAMQTRTVVNNPSPNFTETFVFNHLTIPLIRRSSCQLLNNSSAFGQEDIIVKSKKEPVALSPFGSSVHRRRKVGITHFLEVSVYDTAASPGAGEKIAEADINLTTIPEGRRQTITLDLQEPAATAVAREAGRRKSYMAASDTIFNPNRSSGENTSSGSQLPAIQLTIEPIGIGVQQRGGRRGTVEGGDTRSAELMKALQDELRDTFSQPLIAELHNTFVACEEEGIEGLKKPEMADFLEHLYFFTGTPVPDDAEISADVDFLFAVFDKDRNSIMNVGEICSMLKASAFASHLKPRWRKGASAQVVTAASIAGCLWTAVPPAPFLYPGFRRVDGHVVERTRRPPDAAMVKEKYVFKEDGYLESTLLSSSAGNSPKKDISGDSVSSHTPSDSGRSSPSRPTSPTSQASHSKSQLKTAPSFSGKVVSPNEDKLQRVFGETFNDMYLERLELASCKLNHCTVVSCKLVSGTVVGGHLEACESSYGCDIRDLAAAARTCLFKNSRITDSLIVNSQLFQCEMIDGRRLMQSTGLDCKLKGTISFTYSKLKDCQFDGELVLDEGGNLLENCSLVQ